MVKLAVIDTMFSRVDMGAIAIDELEKNYPDVEIERRTVPGVKDLAVECKKMLERGFDSALALGMVGGAPVDQVCAHEGSLGIQQAKLMTNKHIVEAFIHENEAWSESEFVEICNNRIRKHAHNAVLLVSRPKAMVQFAGRGVRQGKDDEGPISSNGRSRIAIVVSRFNSDITSQMEEKARGLIPECGAVCGPTINVSGVFEIPLAAKKLLMDKKNDGVVCLGAVIKGDTAHDELIAKTVSRKISDLSLEFRKPATLGIIGHDADYESAEERAEGYAERAVKAAIGLIEVLRI